MTVKEMIVDYLQVNGYGGLVNQEIPCGCLLDELEPGLDCMCGDVCEAGYVHFCDDCSPANREECTVEDCPSIGGYCVGPEKEITHYVEPPREPWIVDAMLQDVVEFYDNDGQTKTGVVKMIDPDHRGLKVLVEGQEKLEIVTQAGFVRIVGSDGASDGNAAADFDEVGVAVAAERRRA